MNYGKIKFMVNKTIASERNYSNLNHRLFELMNSKKITMQTLAKEAGVAIGTIQKLMTDPSCNPTIASIEAICNVLDVSISEILGQKEKLNASNVFLLEWEELPLILSNTEYLSKLANNKRETIKTSCPVSKHSFALKIRDNTMLPLFPEHTTLIFDPDKTPRDNNYVIVKINNHKSILFKQLIIDKPFEYVISINPLFRENTIKLESSDKIIGVLIQSQMQY